MDKDSVGVRRRSVGDFISEDVDSSLPCHTDLKKYVNLGVEVKV